MEWFLTFCSIFTINRTLPKWDNQTKLFFFFWDYVLIIRLNGIGYEEKLN